MRTGLPVLAELTAVIIVSSPTSLLCPNTTAPSRLVPTVISAPNVDTFALDIFVFAPTEAILCPLISVLLPTVTEF